MNNKHALINTFGAPLKWRKGQTLFNFFQWLSEVKGLSTTQSQRMADPFHLSDEEFNLYYKEYIETL